MGLLGGISIVFWDLYMSDGIPVLCLGPVFCIIILYKSLPEQSLEIMRHNINGSMAEQKRSAASRLLRGLRSTNTLSTE